MAVVVALDAGTTGVRALAVDEAGAPCGLAYEELPQHFPRPGWVEHDPVEIAEAVRRVLAAVHGQLEATGRSVAAVGVTNQRETAVAWSRRDGRPLAPAVVWQDRRTADRCAEMEAAGHLPAVREATGLVLDPYFSATKWGWLLGQGGVDAGADLALGTVDTWVVWLLTGGAVHGTDPSNASRTLLYDIRSHRWSDELCDLFGVPPAALPEVLPSSGRRGTTVAGCGLPAGIPVAGVAGDQQAALFGQACFEAGMAKSTYGTGGFVLLNVGTADPGRVEGLLTTVAWRLGDADPVYALEGAVFSMGSAVQWLRDGLGVIGTAAEVEPLAASVEDSAGCVVVPAFTGLGSPRWDPYARGAVLGLSRGVGRAHLARATLEAMAFQTRDVTDAMAGAAGLAVAELRADGGAAVDDLLLQLQADQLQVPVVRPLVTETTALGAAYLAGLAEGVWSSPDEVAGHWRPDRRFAPAADRAAADAAHARWLRGVERAGRWAT